MKPGTLKIFTFFGLMACSAAATAATDHRAYLERHLAARYGMGSFSAHPALHPALSLTRVAASHADSTVRPCAATPVTANAGCGTGTLPAQDTARAPHDGRTMHQ